MESKDMVAKPGRREGVVRKHPCEKTIPLRSPGRIGKTVTGEIREELELWKEETQFPFFSDRYTLHRRTEQTQIFRFPVFS